MFVVFYILYFIVLFTVILSTIRYHIRKEIYIISCPENNNNNIPKKIFMTYKDKSLIPNKIYENLNKYAQGYEINIYNDKECVDFLRKHFKKEVANKFISLSGAHKADLFRYCILYINGGVYLDIKTELIKNLDEIFTLPKTVYTVLSINKYTVYQGVIATPPLNPLFLKLINFIVNTPTILSKFFYLLYCKDFYDKIYDDIGRNPTPGLNEGKNNNYYLFVESCSTDANLCNGLKDRYGLCCYIYDNKNAVIKTRYHDFPW